MQSKKIVIGLVSEIAAGKGTVAKYLQKKYQASTYRFSTMLRDVLDRFHLPQTRKNLVLLSETIRQTFGQDCLAKVIALDVKNDRNRVVIVEGIRRKPDIKYLRKIPEFKLIKITADPKIRYSRLITRNENADDKSKTYKQFIADHKQPTETTIKEVMKQADLVIDNSGTLKELYDQIDKIIKNR